MDPERQADEPNSEETERELLGVAGPNCYGPDSRMALEHPAWYCARTQAKHEHIAAVNVRKNLNLEVFHPQLRVERTTRRGVVRVTEPVFPCYIFVRCVIGEKLRQLQRTTGISTVLRFGDKYPTVPDRVMEELQECFGVQELSSPEERLPLGAEVVVGKGAFAGTQAYILRLMPARQRVQILLDVLCGPTLVEVDRSAVMPGKASGAEHAGYRAAAN
jgi:transcriptional antiterminator RfaH